MFQGASVGDYPMRWKEIVGEDYLTAKKSEPDTDLIDKMYSTLSTVLMVLVSEYSDSDTAVVNTDAIINMVKNAGFKTFTYDLFVKAQEHPTIAAMVKNYNRSTVVLNVKSKNASGDVIAQKDKSDKIVKKMAKSAMRS